MELYSPRDRAPTVSVAWPHPVEGWRREEVDVDGDEVGAGPVPGVANSPAPGTPSSASQRGVLLLAAVTGLALGWVGARPLSGLAAGNILIWAVAVVALGAITGTAPGKAVRLGVFGFVLGVAFMCFGYSGEESLTTKVLPFALIGLFCAVCAIALGALVHVIRSRIASSR